MAERIATGGVHPDGGVLLHGWVGDQQQGIALRHRAHMAGALAEHRAVHGGTKYRGLRGRQRWHHGASWRGRTCTANLPPSRLTLKQEKRLREKRMRRVGPSRAAP